MEFNLLNFYFCFYLTIFILEWNLYLIYMIVIMMELYLNKMLEFYWVTYIYIKINVHLNKNLKILVYNKVAKVINKV